MTITKKQLEDIRHRHSEAGGYDDYDMCHADRGALLDEVDRLREILCTHYLLKPTDGRKTSLDSCDEHQ